jgi:hypothetical protein
MDPQQKIYIVTSGDYSDYSIDGVFSTEEKAQEYVDSRKSDTTIEVYTIDKMVDYHDKTRYSVSINYESGELKDRYTQIPDTDNGDDGWIDTKWLRTDYSKISWIHVTSYKSADHADKLAIEARQEVQRLIGQGMSRSDINAMWGNV